jgi:hypothetical protein
MNTDFPKTLQELNDSGYMDDSLFVAILDNLADDDPIRDLVEIAEHGISGGYGNFIYYRDTVAFFDTHVTSAFAMLSGLDRGNNVPTNMTELKNWIVWFVVESYAHIVYSIADEQGEL